MRNKLDRVITQIKNIGSSAYDLFRSRRGKDIYMFAIFLAISVCLWFVMSLNEEEQCDMRLPVRVTHIPDSITLISRGPEALSVSFAARGTQLLKLRFGHSPSIDIDFRAYRSKNRLLLSGADLKGLVRSATGGSIVSAVYPDSINIPYTSHPGVKLPVHLDAVVEPGPQAALTGRPHISVDSVRVYTPSGNTIPSSLHYISTEPLRLMDVRTSFTKKVALMAPPGTRVVPDSVAVSYDVEPLIIKTRKVVIEPVNVPADVKLITFPAQIDVHYMVPMSLYATTNPRFRVLADYRHLSGNTSKMPLRLVDVPDELENVHLSADSAEFFLEHR